MTRLPERIGEAEVLRSVTDYLARFPSLIRVWRQNTGAMYDARGRFVRFGVPGAADLTGLLAGGRRVEIECKAPDGKLAEAQVHYRDGIIEMGGLYVVARSIEDVVSLTRRNQS